MTVTIDVIRAIEAINIVIISNVDEVLFKV